MNTTIHITAEYTDRLAIQYNAAVAECMPFSVRVRVYVLGNVHIVLFK